MVERMGGELDRGVGGEWNKEMVEEMDGVIMVWLNIKIGGGVCEEIIENMNGWMGG